MRLLSPWEHSVLEMSGGTPHGGIRTYEISSTGSKFEEEGVLFYLKYGLTTRKTKVFISTGSISIERLLNYSEGRTKGKLLDPLAFLCCAVAGILGQFAPGNSIVEEFIRETVRTRHYRLLVLIYIHEDADREPRRDSFSFTRGPLEPGRKRS